MFDHRLIAGGLIAGALLGAVLMPPAAFITPANAQAAKPMPDFIDNRSIPGSLIRSYYNAVERQEYLRAWSYFAEGDDRPGWPAFEEGYAKTQSVLLKIGTVEQEGSAGTVWARVPIVIEAKETGRIKRVYSGCYLTEFVEPTNQATPPYRPLQIARGLLSPVETEFDATVPECGKNFSQ